MRLPSATARYANTDDQRCSMNHQRHAPFPLVDAVGLVCANERIFQHLNTWEHLGVSVDLMEPARLAPLK